MITAQDCFPVFSLCNYWSVCHIFKCFVSGRDLTWRLRWAAPPSGPHPEHGCGSEISWEPRPTPCPGSPFHPPHSWHIRGQTEQNEWNQFVPRLTGLSWPRFYHGGYVSIYKRGCYEGFLVTFVPWVILITWRILMSWVCRSSVLCCFLLIKLLIAMPPHPPMFWYKLSFFVVVHADKDPLTFVQLYKA